MIGLGLLLPLFCLVLLVRGEAFPLILVVFVLCAASLWFAWWLASWTLSKDEGTPAMQVVSDAIREGSEGFLQIQYNTIFRLALVCAALLFVFFFLRAPSAADPEVTETTMAVIVAASFLTGALCSSAAGYVGMWVAVRTNIRLASAARRSYNEALQIALRGGAFSGVVVIALCVLGLCTWFAILHVFYVPAGLKEEHIPNLLVGYGFGSSFVALFAQLGGGIYTKAADVGADLVGKVESNIPEDDPRNPAVIADLVGDNVGDCAGRGADLFESIAGEIIGAMILGGNLAVRTGCGSPVSFMFFPIVIHAFDLVVSSIGALSVKVNVGIANEDPMAALLRGYRVSIGLACVGIVIATRWLLYTPVAPEAWWHFCLCGFVGVATAYAFVLITQYYTDYHFRPVRSIVEASTTGHGTNIIAGVAVGMESTALPIVVICVSVLLSFALGQNSGLVDAKNEPQGGLFGTAVATMGMLSTAAYILAMDTFGPIADNAGGIAEMSGQPEHVREITDRLDAVGNVTKATTKGYSIGSAALACFLLFSAYMDEVEAFSGRKFQSINVAIPEVFVGGLLGAMLVYLFSSLAIHAVGRTAQDVVREVRRQFREKPGIMTGQEKPDYHHCVAIVAQAALNEMKAPGLLAVGMPVFVGFVFKYVGIAKNEPLLGVEVLGGFLMSATVSGILMALFLNNAGGAWDNAKKLVETGMHGGKGSETHKATVTGDTVGDPFKDTAGPSLHVLIKLLSTVTLVLCPLFLG
eukprot:TRINITY_DN5729_c0_g1_i1.p1 TRINITY_DN5729_c0_g1~~TRINITY_DN5729_c0_g1_i1.p1  ORF type:complete len:801 (-),score=180.30 TRINITY_DN5729_c0_g1_i1:28-2283(-)